MPNYKFKQLIYGQFVDSDNKMSGFRPLCATVLDKKTVEESLKWYEESRPKVVIGSPDLLLPIYACSWTIKNDHYIWSNYYFNQDAEWASKERRNFIMEYHIFFPLDIFDNIPITLGFLFNLSDAPRKLLHKRYQDFEEIPPITTTDDIVSRCSSNYGQTLIKYLKQIQNKSPAINIGLWILDNFSPQQQAQLKSTTLSLDKRLEVIDFAWHLLPKDEAKQFTFCSHSYANSPLDSCAFRFWEEKVPAPSKVSSAYTSSIEDGFISKTEGYASILAELAKLVVENDRLESPIIDLFKKSNISEIKLFLVGKKYEYKDLVLDDIDKIFEQIIETSLRQSNYELIYGLLQRITVFAKKNIDSHSKIQFYLRKNNLLRRLLENNYEAILLEIIGMFKVQERIKFLSEAFVYISLEGKNHYLELFKKSIKDCFDVNHQLDDVDSLLEQIRVIGYYEKYNTSQEELLNWFFSSYLDDEILSMFLQKWAKYGLPQSPYKAHLRSNLYAAYEKLLDDKPIDDALILDDGVKKNIRSFLLIALKDKLFNFLTFDFISQVCALDSEANILGSISKIKWGWDADKVEMNVELAAFVELADAIHPFSRDKKFFSRYEDKNVVTFIRHVISYMENYGNILWVYLPTIYKKYISEIELDAWLSGLKNSKIQVSEKRSSQILLAKEYTKFIKGADIHEFKSKLKKFIEVLEKYDIRNDLKYDLISLGVEISKVNVDAEWLFEFIPSSWRDELISQILSLKTVNTEYLDAIVRRLNFLNETDLAKRISEKKQNAIKTIYDLAIRIQQLMGNRYPGYYGFDDAKIRVALELVQDNINLFREYKNYREFTYYLLALDQLGLAKAFLELLDEYVQSSTLSEIVKNGIKTDISYIAPELTWTEKVVKLVKGKKADTEKKQTHLLGERNKKSNRNPNW